MDRPLTSRRDHDDMFRHDRRNNGVNSHEGGRHHHDYTRHRAPFPHSKYEDRNHHPPHFHDRQDHSRYGPPPPPHRCRSRSRDHHDRRNDQDRRDPATRRTPLRDNNAETSVPETCAVREPGTRHTMIKDIIRNIPQPKDENLPTQVQKDPRGEDPALRLTQKASNRGVGRNTESFDPASTLVRPDLRVLIGSAKKETFHKRLKHDDVVIVPELFGDEDNWDTYYQLVKEITELQQKQVKGSEFISWHEGAHLIVKKPEESPTFQHIIDKLCQYFNIQRESAGYRFNWYKDSSDWKPFHHDSAAFNPQRAKNQNITVGASFGATRELAFIRASEVPEAKLRLYFPQTNNGVFTFGRDVNILWKHGVNALSPEDQDGKGRISIILWGLAQDVVEEAGSPPLLGSDGQGPHAASRNGPHARGHRRSK